MLKNRYKKVIVFFMSLLVLGCVGASNASDPVIIMQQTAGQSERFTQFELDVAFRTQAREDEKALDPENKYNVCCVLFYDDVKMLANVFTHFEENFDANVNDYGVIVQENDKYYIVTFSERYRESMQVLVDGFWNPGISDSAFGVYSYLVDRKTLEILEFTEMPS
jgi:hypothetical protein